MNANVTFTLAQTPIPQITRADYIKAGVAMLSINAVQTDMRQRLKNPTSIGAAFLLQELRNGAESEMFENLRESVYAAAESAGFAVNRKSNTVGVLTSKACTIADSPVRDEILSQAGSFNAAYTLAKKAKDEAKASAEREALESEAEALLATLPAKEREAAALDRLIEFVESLADTYGLDESGIIAIMKRAMPKKSRKAAAE